MESNSGPIVTQEDENNLNMKKKAEVEDIGDVVPSSPSEIAQPSRGSTHRIGEAPSKQLSFSSKNSRLTTELQKPSVEITITDKQAETDISTLLKKAPKLQKRRQKQYGDYELKDQMSLLSDQIIKMKSGLTRLQEIASEFNTAEVFYQDLDFLIENVKTAIKPRAKSKKRSKISKLPQPETI